MTTDDTLKRFEALRASSNKLGDEFEDLQDEFKEVQDAWEDFNGRVTRVFRFWADKNGMCAACLSLRPASWHTCELGDRYPEKAP